MSAFAEPYVAYSYAYPHKTAYRPFDPIPLSEVWRDERRDALFLYLHVPFCRMRCGFCNLFTTTDASPARRYLDTVKREARAVSGALGEAKFARIAVGGGTPTLLEPGELDQIFDSLSSLGASPAALPTSVEASPDTITRERLVVLRARGVSRLSVGVQSFDEEESKRMGRPQRRAEVLRALALCKQAGFPILNLDLIYGGEDQTIESFLQSVREALRFEPEELYLYPLYVRRLTGLGRLRRSWNDQRLSCYRAARDLLRTVGYEQVSMRMFRRAGLASDDGPIYCCQEDGMVGLGAGARSYTRGLHYSTEWAVGRAGVRQILDAYLERSDGELAHASYGFALDGDERRRRWAIQSLLQCEGLDRAAYVRAFGSDVLDDLPQLAALFEEDFAVADGARVRLTAAGLERSDAIGPWLGSERVRARMETFSWR